MKQRYMALGRISNVETLKLDAMRLKTYPRSEPTSPFLSSRRFSWSSSRFSLITPNDPLNVFVCVASFLFMRHWHCTTASLPPLFDESAMPPFPLLSFTLRATIVHPSVCHPRVSVFHHAHQTHHTSGLPFAEKRAVLA